jgi:deoxyribonuclease-2
LLLERKSTDAVAMGRMFWLARVVTFFLVLVVLLTDGGPSCLDEGGDPVDGWVALKEANSFNVFVQIGPKFVKSKYMLNQTKSGGMKGSVMRTASQLYNIPTSSAAYAVALYNDQPPFMSASSSYAHGKGMLITDSTSGFWFVHSMPRWPANLSSNASPGPFPSDVYGQSITCITVSAASADLIASNLMAGRPAIYSSRFDSALAATLPSFKALVAGSFSKSSTPVSSEITSLGGTKYTQFVKSNLWGKDIYDDLVAPAFKTALSVETWRNGAGGRMSSICGQGGPKAYNYEIYEVERVKMPNGVSWPGTSDHSKWAISTTAYGSGAPATLVTCIGDIKIGRAHV